MSNEKNGQDGQDGQDKQYNSPDTRDNINNDSKMKRSLQKHKKLVVSLVLLAFMFFTLLLCYELILTSAGNFLLKDEAPQEASYVVVLQGGIPDRIVHGVELYQQDYGDEILMVESKSFNNYELIDEHELDLPSSVEINQEAALQMGVNAEDLKIIPGKADSTSQEAEMIGGYLAEQEREKSHADSGEEACPSRSKAPEENLEEGNSVENNPNNDTTILLVTSRFHSNRARLIFEDELAQEDLDDKVNIISTPSPYDPFDPENWWKDRRQARNTFMEYLKLINLYTFGL